MQQLALPGFPDVEYQCPACGQVATLFGQYDPHRSVYVCKPCSQRWPYPVALMVASTRRSATPGALMVVEGFGLAAIKPKLEMEAAIRRNAGQGWLIPRFAEDGRARGWRSRPARVPKLRLLRESWQWRQIVIPECRRCGCIHRNTIEVVSGLVNYQDYCQRCADEMTVERMYSLEAHRPGAPRDVEDVFEQLQRAFPGLFERGVLPDYWYKLIFASDNSVFEGK